MVLLLYALLSALYRGAVPLGEAPDEPGHLEYVLFVAERLRPPSYRGVPEVPGEGVQGPLYYALAAPLVWAAVPAPAVYAEELHRANLTLYRYDPGAINANRLLRLRRIAPGERLSRLFDGSAGLRPLARLRWPSFALGLAAGALFFLAMMPLAGAPTATAGAALLLLNPQMVFVTSYASNDALAVVIGAAALLLVARARRGPRRRDYLLWGTLTALGFMSKNSTLPGLAAALGALLYFDKRRARWRDAALGCGVLLAASLPYLAFNAAHRGDPLGLTALRQSSSHLPGPADFGGRAAYLTRIYLPWTFESYWARFGWMNLRAPAWTFWGFLLLTLGALAGLLKRRDAPAGWTLYLAAAAGLTLLAHFWLNLHFAAAQGRHLFAAAPQIAALLAAGLSGWWSWSERRAWALASALAAVAAAQVWLVLKPAYG